LSGIEVSGKTGTAEAAERKPGVSDQVAKWLKEDHAWFIGFAPSRKPEIVVTVFLEHGHSGGKVAAPVAMRVFKGYFAKRTQRRKVPQNLLPNPITAPGPSDKKQTPKINQEPINLP
jgi:penicillin-binding protein 2